MSVIDVAVFVVIFLAIAVGFFLGRRSAASESHQHSYHDPISQHRYVEGLKHLLDEQPDAAIDALVTGLDINQDTMEMFFSLGALWRKRGQMERAIRVHQTLLESAEVTELQRQQVQLELALDYSYSGLLDRGEVLLKEVLASAHPSVRQAAGRELVLLYQEEREWEKAAAAVDELCGRANIPDTEFWRHLQAHYHCELAERVLGSPDWNDPQLLKNGIAADVDTTDAAQTLLNLVERHAPNHARALLLRSLLALGRRDLGGAREILRRIELVPDYSMVLVPLMQSVSGAEPDTLVDGLIDFYRNSNDPATLPFLADLLARQDAAGALDFLSKELSAQIDLEPLAKLLWSMDVHASEYDKIRRPLRELLPFHFNCHQCGFQGLQFYWCCPSCKAWL